MDESKFLRSNLKRPHWCRFRASNTGLREMRIRDCAEAFGSRSEDPGERFAFSSLFCPKCFDWVYKCCAPRGQETCKQRDHAECERCGRKKGRIMRRNLVKLRGE